MAITSALSHPGGVPRFYPSERERQHPFHVRLTHFNAKRLSPALPPDDWIDQVRVESETLIEEGLFVERERRLIRVTAADAPLQPQAFLSWFEQLRETGPGQGDALFPWLGSIASLSEMRWFLAQEAAGEAGFEDLVAVTQVRFPIRAKLEMARNYWDEMGRGRERGTHGPMLGVVLSELNLEPRVECTVWESLALANLMGRSLPIGVTRITPSVLSA